MAAFISSSMGFASTKRPSKAASIASFFVKTVDSPATRANWALAAPPHILSSVTTGSAGSRQVSREGQERVQDGSVPQRSSYRERDARGRVRSRDQ
jgi:hypothetical protein